ncbi:TrkH-domain-containing protein [Wolfiporia cocos MD-104 SS10]|uniref:Potassium transport protein n=1 Tax=Wolfiporia cocos (strain MD-104) TaxID=742152 RepID=A0A2H3JUL1_WOLCO|nr:TrkH-domain-containing protein [Wolfiporia cocos MD-104 SS10]
MWSHVTSNLDFYRIHLFFLVFCPLILSAIAYASNGEFKIHYIDLLFVFVSGSTGTGLTTIDLSSTTTWQQVILAILEITGNPVFVSWIVVYIRRRYFLSRLEFIVAAQLEKRPAHTRSVPAVPTFQVVCGAMPGSSNKPPWSGVAPKSKRYPPIISSDMVRRVDVEPHKINPMGTPTRTASHDSRATAVARSPAAMRLALSDSREANAARVRFPDREAALRGDDDDNGGFPSVPQMVSRTLHAMFPRLHRRIRRTVTMPRTKTLIPRVGDMGDSSAQPPSPVSVEEVSYLPFRATVGRNSTFHGLTADQAEELGGMEYRALTALLWIVPLYYFGLLAISFIVIAPYMALSRWQYNFMVPQQHRNINSIWFSAFQVVGAWANTGMSLVDQNMIPFRTAYPMIIFLVICVLAGNSLFPVFLRFMIWILLKLSPEKSRTEQTLAFLLDHPRRCFIYLFPSSQTWLLFSIQIGIDLTSCIATLILDLGNPATGTISGGVRVINAVLAAVAVRSSGFQSIPISTLVPAVQVLYTILMYINIYPIALSVRSTNVYEDKALGIYEADKEKPFIDPDELEQQWRSGAESRVAIWGKDLMRHARKQLSYDMWWLALSLFLLCIIERDGLMNTDNDSWFNVFALIFELVSAYGTVGLSLGIPYANYSFSGALHTLSKLIICAVMIRGRHRGLPVALDRAVLLPHHLQRREDDPAPPSAGAPETPTPRAEEKQLDLMTTTTTSRSRSLSFAGDGMKETAGAVRIIDRIPELEEVGRAVERSPPV